MMFLFALLILALVNAAPLELVHDKLLKTNQWDQEGSLSELNQLFVDYDDTDDSHVDPAGLGKSEVAEVPDYGLGKLDSKIRDRILADIRDENHMINDEQPEDEELAAEFSHEKIDEDEALHHEDEAGNAFIGEPRDPENLGAAPSTIKLPQDDGSEPAEE